MMVEARNDCYFSLADRSTAPGEMIHQFGAVGLCGHMGSG